MLQRRAEDLWTVDHPLSLMGMRLGARMTVARLPAGDLWLHSPVPIDDALAAAIDALGAVRWVVAPNLWHHLYVGAALARWPKAALAAPAALPETKQPDLEVAFPLAAGTPAAWGGAIEVIPVDGMPKVQESAFLHRPSRTLIVTDCLFNLQRSGGLWSRALLRLAGSSGGPRQSRLLRAMVKDRAAFGRAMGRLLALDFDRLIMAHGEVIEVGGAAALARASAWARPAVTRVGSE